MGSRKSLFSSLTGRRPPTEVAVGQRYKKRDASWVVWEVATLSTGTDGMAYAQLVRIDDPTVRKTVSPTILEQGAEYLRVRDFP